MDTYDIGDRVRVSASFSQSGTATDPTVVTFSYRKPSGVTTLLTYVTDVAIVKDSTGEYHIDIDPTIAGRWDYRWQGTGAVVAAEESAFAVRTQAVIA